MQEVAGAPALPVGGCRDGYGYGTPALPVGGGRGALPAGGWRRTDRGAVAGLGTRELACGDLTSELAGAGLMGAASFGLHMLELRRWPARGASRLSNGCSKKAAAGVSMVGVRGPGTRACCSGDPCPCPCPCPCRCCGELSLKRRSERWRCVSEVERGSVCCDHCCLSIRRERSSSSSLG